MARTPHIVANLFGAGRCRRSDCPVVPRLIWEILPDRHDEALAITPALAWCGLGDRAVQCSSTTSCYFFLPEPIVGCRAAVF